MIMILIDYGKGSKADYIPVKEQYLFSYHASNYNYSMHSYSTCNYVASYISKNPVLLKDNVMHKRTQLFCDLRVRINLQV